MPFDSGSGRNLPFVIDEIETLAAPPVAGQNPEVKNHAE